tara:strand:+ start:850 stop:1191 length:342 start_codon:yes stop_codon:yes gene_type:complete
MTDKNTYDECMEIINDKKNLNDDDLQKKWGNFKEKFPKLYTMLTLEKSIDLEILKYLCETADQYQNESKEKQINMNMDVSNFFANKYIPNYSNKITENNKESIKNKIREKLDN